MLDQLIDITLLTFLLITTIAIIRVRNLIAVIILFGIFSLLSAGVLVIMDAVDVAFTEAAVGAGVSTVLLLATMALTYKHKEEKIEKRPVHTAWLPLIVVVITGAVLIYGTSDIPSFGDAHSPPQTHVAPHYLGKGMAETGVPNIVTAVLASYRGFDTLGEVTVIFTAGVAVLLLLGSLRRRDAKDKDEDHHET